MSLQRAAGEVDFSCVKNVIMNLMAAGAAVDGRESGLLWPRESQKTLCHIEVGTLTSVFERRIQAEWEECEKAWLCT